MDSHLSGDVKATLKTSFPHISTFLSKFPLSSKAFQTEMQTKAGSALLNVIQVRLVKEIFDVWRMDTKTAMKTKNINGVKVDTSDVLAWLGFKREKTYRNTRSDIDTLFVAHRFLLKYEDWPVVTVGQDEEGIADKVPDFRTAFDVFFGDEPMEALRLAY